MVQLLVDELDQVHAWRVAAHTDDTAAAPASQGTDQLLLRRHRSRGLDPRHRHPRQSVSASTRASTSSSAALIVALAPNSLASASRGADRSTASTSAPIAWARSTVASPTGPTPKTISRSGTCGARRVRPWYAVQSVQASRDPTSRLNVGGSGRQLRSLVSSRSVKAPSGRGAVALHLRAPHHVAGA